MDMNPLSQLVNVQPSEALLPYRTQAVEFDGGDWMKELQARAS